MFITKVRDYQRIAKEKLSEEVFNYFYSGSDQEITRQNNISAFQGIKLYPRVLRDMRNICIKTHILGQQVDLPFGIAPFAFQRLIDPQGQLISSKIARQRNTAFGLSMMTTTKISEIVTKPYNKDGLKIMQIYLMKNSQLTEKVIKYVQDHGFSAIAITVDTQAFGKRKRYDKNVFMPGYELELWNELGIRLFFRPQNPSQSFIQSIKLDINWQLIDQIKAKTKLKVILKGILSAEDAQVAFKHGINAIWISNHGGRQLDTTPAAIWILPSIKQRVRKLQQQCNRKMEIYIDGGIYKGSDIFKCLALGADFVFLGRAFLYSLIDGQKGMNNCFDVLTNELKNTMTICGTRSLKQINQNYIFNPPSKL